MKMVGYFLWKLSFLHDDIRCDAQLERGSDGRSKVREVRSSAELSSHTEASRLCRRQTLRLGRVRLL
jgi:hypothetical protein